MDFLTPPNGLGPKKIFATAYGISEFDCAQVRFRMEKLFDPVAWGSMSRANLIQLRRDLKCAELMDRLRKATGLHHLQFRHLRHTFVVNAKRAGLDAFEIASKTGHSPKGVEDMLRRHYLPHDSIVAANATRKMERSADRQLGSDRYLLRRHYLLHSKYAHMSKYHFESDRYTGSRKATPR